MTFLRSKAKVKWDHKNEGFKISFILFGTYYILFSVGKEPWQYYEGDAPFAQPAFDSGSAHFGKSSTDLKFLDALYAFQHELLNQRQTCPRVTSYTEYQKNRRPD